MNKKLLLQTILTFISLNYYCQAAFNKGSGYLTMGYGFPPLFEEILIDKKIGYGYSTGGFSHSENYSYKSKSFGPVQAKCEFATKKHRGVTLILGYSSLDITETRTYSDNLLQNGDQFTDITRLDIKALSFGFRYNIHFFKSRILDPYVGFGGGYMLVLKDTYFQSDRADAVPTWMSQNLMIPPLFVSVSAGLRYYFHPQIGAYAEFGFDNWAIAQIGIALKFD